MIQTLILGGGEIPEIYMGGVQITGGMRRGWKLGKGNKIMFWSDRCLGNDSLKNIYLRIFLNLVEKRVQVNNMVYGMRISGNGRLRGEKSGSNGNMNLLLPS